MSRPQDEVKTCLEAGADNSAHSRGGPLKVEPSRSCNM